jgi:hypothetical protein
VLQITLRKEPGPLEFKPAHDPTEYSSLDEKASIGGYTIQNRLNP